MNPAFLFAPAGRIAKVAANAAAIAETNNNLTDLVTVEVTSTTVSVPSGSAYSSSDHLISYYTPPGYKPVAIVQAWAKSSSDIVYNAYLSSKPEENNLAYIQITNLTGTKKTVNVSLGVLFIK